MAAFYASGILLSTVFAQSGSSFVSNAEESSGSGTNVLTTNSGTGTAVDNTIRLTPASASAFNDTNGDGLGEFQGWGTSLCWWANRVGYSDALTSQAAEDFYGEDGLMLNIGRYNIGGGDNVGDTQEVPVNANASIYDLSSGSLPTYEGSSMSIGTNTNLSTYTYSKSDADFGITSGKSVGSFQAIGWINALNASVGAGGNLHYPVEAKETGTYTVKMLVTLAGTNERGVSLQVTQPQNVVVQSSVSTADGSEPSKDNAGTSSGASEALDTSSEVSETAGEGAHYNSANIAASADVSAALEESAEEASAASTKASSESTKETSFASALAASSESTKEVSAASTSASSAVSMKEASAAGTEATVSIEGETKVYTVSSDTVNANVLASGNNNKIFLVTFSNVALTKGTNTFTIGGADDDWCLDFIKMAVIKSGEEGVLSKTSDFYHASHITRSDSAVPGYCTDVTAIDLEAHDAAYYTDNFVRADFDCGYAWNYDWDADANQVNVLKAAAKASGDDFLAEAFSNSPPYFMTVSGCSSGNADASKDNLRSDSYTAFACYMADVIEHWDKEGVITFQSTDPMNEPYTNYWSAYSAKQEGCHFDLASESKILVELNKQLEAKGINILISATDETSIDTAITAYNALTDEAKGVVDRIDTHSYSGSDRSGLQDLAQSEGKNLWMSEVDGSVTAGTSAGEMAPALGFADLIKRDINGMQPSAWIMWDAIDIHIDKNSSSDYASQEAMYKGTGIKDGDGFWGIAVADHNNGQVLLTKKYYAYGQFTRYIRPGYTLIASGDDTVAAYDPEDGKIVIVAVNEDDEDQTWKYNMSDFTSIGDAAKVTAIRTSGSMESGENWADVSAADDITVDQSTKAMTATAKANSITTYIISGVTYDSSAETIVSVGTKNIYAVNGTTAILPDTVTVTTSKNNQKQVPVVWSTEGVDLTSAGTITGSADGYEFTANIVFVDPNMAYFIDCNNVKSTSYTDMDSYADLLNETADQAYTDGSWGYLASYGAYNASSLSDAWASGWYAYSKQNIEYTLPLSEGSYNVTFGFKEWWSNGTDYRPMEVYAVTQDGTETKLGTTSSMNGTKTWNTPVYSMKVAKDGNVTYSVRAAKSSDPVLSFIKVQHVLDLTALKSAMASAQAYDTSVLTSSAAARLQTMIENAMDRMLKSATTQEEIDEMTQELTEFLKTNGKVFSESEIAANDYCLYLVDCGSKDTAVVPNDYVMGLYQSVTDQVSGIDKGTGLTWGYAADDTNSKRSTGGSSDGTLTGTYIYMSGTGWTYKEGVSGLYYSFELPERSNNDYVVTVGVKNPWSARTIDISLEGKTAESGLSIAQSSLVEKTYNTSVTDGTLNLYVSHPGRTSQYQDPILSYIIVKAVPEYTTEILRTALSKYAAAMEGHEYSVKTQAAYDSAADAAQALIDAKSKDSVTIKAAYTDLVNAYESLFEVYKKTYTSITGVNGDTLYDNNGIEVQAHGGQIQQLTVDGVTKYYWYGEDKTYDGNPVIGVHLYTSVDLYNWTDEGVVLQTIPVAEKDYGKDQESGYTADLSIFETDTYFKELYGDYAGLAADNSLYSSKLEEVYWNLANDRCVLERPKVLYNDATDKYVMWFHCDGRTPASSASYGKAMAGVAISDSPAGPFKFLGAYKLNYSTDANHSWDSAASAWGSVRDMNVFKDEDGSAYVIYSSDGNTNMYIAKLNDSYTNVAKSQDEAVLGKDFTLNFEGASREAPAMFKYNGKYYMITSACTGWAANAAKYAVADSPLGPWTIVSNPCTGTSAGTTYDTQSTCVFAVDAAAGKFIYMGDRWNSSDLSESKYVWLPVEFTSDSTIELKRYSDWTLDTLDNMAPFEVVTDLPKTAASASELSNALPSEVAIKLSDGSTRTLAVTWSGLDDIGLMGEYEVTGTLENSRTITDTVSIIPKKMIYFFDCAGKDISSTYLTAARNALGLQLLNDAADAAYTSENGAGYTGTLQSDNASSYDLGTKNSGNDIWSHGYWAGSGKTIDYAFDLAAGDYSVSTGYQEWWNTARPTKITVKDENGKTLASTAFTLSATDTALIETLDFTLPSAGKVTVSAAKTGSPDPVLSFIGVVQNSMEDVVLSNRWGTTYCKKADGSAVTGFKTIDGATYYFNEKGAMQKDTQVIDGKTYFFGNDGKMRTGFVTRWFRTYYYNSKGIMQTGFVTVNGAAYYFGANGCMEKDMQTIDGKTYYFNSDGIMQTGFVTKWLSVYYFNSKGIMQTGFTAIDGATYYFDASGRMQTYRQTIDGKTYYFGSNGKMQTGEITIWGKTYTFGSDGVLVG